MYFLLRIEFALSNLDDYAECMLLIPDWNRHQLNIHCEIPANRRGIMMRAIYCEISLLILHHPYYRYHVLIPLPDTQYG